MIYAAFSGGKDSTAMALGLADRGVDFKMVFTATGNEIPGVDEHITRVSKETGAELVCVPAPRLVELIQEQQCLPSFRMRWCTRMIKIDPMQEWLPKDATLAVGLRADEEGRVGGTYDNAHIVYPLRDWGWGLVEVVRRNEQAGLTPPPRTDCAWCYDQTLYEWFVLWRDHPKTYAHGATWEMQIGHTFRSPQRDTQPTSLVMLGAKFARGYAPKQRKRNAKCRVCSL